MPPQDPVDPAVATSEAPADVVVTLMPTDPAAKADGGLRGRAYRLLMRAVAEVTGVPVAEVELGREPAGRPIVLGPAAHAHVSLAHTPGLVAVAVSTRAEIGVDVEGSRQVDTIRLARRWLAVRDVRWLAGLPEAERTEAFLWLWTHKEALGKMAGIGLRGDSLRAEVPQPQPWQPAALLDLPADVALTARPDGRSWLAAFRTTSGHQIALALAAGTGDPNTPQAPDAAPGSARARVVTASADAVP